MTHTDTVEHNGKRVILNLAGSNGIPFERTPDEASALADNIYYALQDLHIKRNECTMDFAMDFAVKRTPNGKDVIPLGPKGE